MTKVLLATLALTLTLIGISWAQQPDSSAQPETQKQEETEKQTQPPAKEIKADPAVDRTRRQVKMLDDIYKGGIVLITEHYVEGNEDLPAGTAFKKLFEAAKKNGWHEVRLVDATGEPFDDENVAVSDFEKRAIELLKSGKPFVEETIVHEEKRFLLAATPIPVVMEKCTMCHANYDMDEPGLVVGALTYRVPIDE